MSPWLRVVLFVPIAFASAGVVQAAAPQQAAPQQAEAKQAEAKQADAPRPADASVKAKLDALELQYEVDGDGDYKLIFSFDDDGRSQMLFVSGGTQAIGDMKVREIFAPAARVEADGVDGAVALEMLADSRTNKLGAWEIGGDVLYYVVKLPDDIDAAQLEQVMHIVAVMADQMEARLTGDRDDL
jgi:hypothetical protein